MFEYLMLMLVRHCGVRNPFDAKGVLYFKTEQTHYKLQSKDGDWLLIDYTPQHNAPNIINREYCFTQGDWREVLNIVKPEPSPE